MADEFFRPQTNDEKKDFKDVGPFKQKDAKILFLSDLALIRAKKNKEKVPFFKKAALDDFDEYYKEQTKMSVRKNGYVKLEDIKPIKMNWKKYSSPDNIKLIEVIEKRDAHVSKKHPFDVFVKSYRYKYKDYGVEGVYNISVMENEVDAVKRMKAIYDNKEYKEVTEIEKISKLYK